MSIATPDKMYCTCEKGDDGTPMINCSECKDWLHFSCISLDETDAEDISVYVCPSCSEKTGLHSLMTWEESDCVESSRKSGPTSGSSNPRKRSKTPKGPTFTVPLLKDEEQTPEPEPPSASEDSDDNYVVDTKAKGARGKRRSRRVSYHSDSDLSDIADKPSSRIRKASSPSLKRLAKRGFDGPPTKKAKASNPVDDPTRKYCLGKLDDVFRDIFLRYPQVHSKGEDDAVQVIEKQTENLTEEERNSVLEASKQFADDLEKCVFEIYSEPDKNGVPTAAAKYKDRFRMLQFNLSKVDRVVLHKRIVSGHITPKEISVMSSTDLANEELKQSIKSAEQESLKQSILTKSNAPRTKITHKGLEDIEDISGRDSNRERERQLEEEERMEKERLARLRPVEPRQRTMSVSNPPESPAALSSEGWGAPPAVPTHVPNPTRPPLFLHASSDLATTTGSELELNLADLINIDDEPGSNQVVVSPKDVQEGSEVDAPAVLRSPTGISPFAIQPAPTPFTSQSAPSPSAQPPTSRASGFDLNSLWSRSNSTSVPSPSAADTIPEAEPEDQKDVVMDSEPVAANDQDFDMLLEEKEPEKPEIDQATFDALPQIWFGKINMPLDSATPQQTPVIGRQMGGNPIAVTSGQWKTLFPSDTLRIDGRVPVENSAKFLLQMRMNPMKELVAVAFAPAPGSDNSAFKIVSEFLINKGRHGLVFPWGNRPKDHHLGKEMYIIPLLSSHPLPDYVELLDDLCLPAIRTTDYLLGIWILNKGRLASPPPQINPPAPIPHMSPSASILTPPLTSTTPMLPIVPISALSPIIPNITGPSARRSIDQNALAAELASLTPEQLAFVTQALANTPLTSIAASATPTSTISSNTGPLSSSRVHMPFTQPWGVQLPLDRDGPSSVPPQPAFSQGDGGSNARQDQGRGSRGNRESRGGRGRGRGRGDNYHMNSPVDSGWPRKNTGQRRW
ncbi:transcription factor S-II, central domain-containing protein [Lentinula aciculospora]|uniref:Transcription factor BYE1 n=1 Tax=Lentinula aciculospora TaxID=153920 RepID=A0A9W8ZYI4_9AGAR|nr:transcription factor S-II, central domain-containing protein [Lentinula aciculospora]